jgi:hypothetical protein
MTRRRIAQHYGEAVEKGLFPNADPEKSKEEGAIREKQSFGELNAW